LNFLKKISRGLTALAIAVMDPKSELEEKERKRRLNERLKHLEQKQKY